MRWGKRGRQVLTSVLMMLAGAVLVLVGAAAVYIHTRPALKLWHERILDGEFTAQSHLPDFNAYLRLEDGLFARLQREIVDQIPTEDRTPFNRYSSGSRSDPANWRPDWNRSFALTPPEPRFGVLLLHGYSDSPYSLRSLGELLHGAGAQVLGLRLPGHGTIPSGLRRTVVEDMAAAVSLAMDHLAADLPGKPIVIVGYSNGAALALHYTLDSVATGGRQSPAALVLISPEIAISPMAALAVWQARIGEWLGLPQLAWTSVEREFDPFKYNSFAVNAGVQARRITLMVQAQLDALARDGGLSRIPPILAFQSAVDATVEAPAVKTALFDRLVSGRDELVVFDVNSVFEMAGLVNRPFDLNGLLNGPAHRYRVSVVGNRDDRSSAAVVRDRMAGADTASVMDLGRNWPQDVYSLAHIALPFPPDDPVYGGEAVPDVQHLNLGRIMLRGENGSLEIPASAMTRQHWNPFHAYLTDRILSFLRANVPAVTP
ncbi:MAG: alpha/beta fold hydrolase [Hyphomicrobiales bacterium]